MLNLLCFLLFLPLLSWHSSNSHELSLPAPEEREWKTLVYLTPFDPLSLAHTHRAGCKCLSRYTRWLSFCLSIASTTMRSKIWFKLLTCVRNINAPNARQNIDGIPDPRTNVCMRGFLFAFMVLYPWSVWLWRTILLPIERENEMNENGRQINTRVWPPLVWIVSSWDCVEEKLKASESWQGDWL